MPGIHITKEFFSIECTIRLGPTPAMVRKDFRARAREKLGRQRCVRLCPHKSEYGLHWNVAVFRCRHQPLETSVGPKNELNCDSSML